MSRSIARSVHAVVAVTTACLAATSGISQPTPRSVQPPVLITFTIEHAAPTVSRNRALLRLSHVMTGSPPTAYRVGTRADFANAPWRPYATPLRMAGWQALLHAGPKCDGNADGTPLQLYLQVRADIGGIVRIVNGQRVVLPQHIESNVLSDAICVTPDT